MNPRALILALLVSLLIYLAFWLTWTHRGIADTGVQVLPVTVTLPLPSTTSSTTTVPPTTTSTSMPRAHETAPMATAGAWDRLAACESGGRWNLAIGPHEGGVQFLHSTWVAAGGRRFAEHAYQATREQQIEIARGWLRRTSPRQWPVCGPRTGLTMAAA